MSTNHTEADGQLAALDGLLRRIGNTWRKQNRDIISVFDITPPQFEALHVLSEHGELTMGELCQQMSLACSTATDLIDRMERNDLIERVRDTGDRRVIRLRVRPRGGILIREVLAARQDFLAGLLTDVDREGRTKLIQVLDQLHTSLMQE